MMMLSFVLRNGPVGQDRAGFVLGVSTICDAHVHEGRSGDVRLPLGGIDGVETEHVQHRDGRYPRATLAEADHRIAPSRTAR